MRKILVLLFFTGSVQSAIAQSLPPFWNEISTFKISDKQNPPPEHEILFVGSSSFRMWDHLNESFPGYKIINRGFGGSQLTDVIRYFYDIILPYHPRQVVIYCGENDLMDVSAHEVSVRFQTLFGMIRKNLPDATIDFVSIKPSPSRMAIRDKVIAANQMIKNFITAQPKSKYIDVYHQMMDKNGKEYEGIFKDDMLHLNAKGYAIWQKVILPYLIK